MGAHPKNKITRVEQGKRRAGNTPKLAKNKAHGSVPKHKSGLFARFTKAVAGAVIKPAKKKTAQKAAPTAKSTTVKPAAVEPTKAKTATKTAKTEKTVKKTAKKTTPAKKPAAKKTAKK